MDLQELKLKFTPQTELLSMKPEPTQLESTVQSPPLLTPPHQALSTIPSLDPTQEALQKAYHPLLPHQDQAPLMLHTLPHREAAQTQPLTLLLLHQDGLHTTLALPAVDQPLQPLELAQSIPLQMVEPSLMSMTLLQAEALQPSLNNLPLPQVVLPLPT